MTTGRVTVPKDRPPKTWEEVFPPLSGGIAGEDRVRTFPSGATRDQDVTKPDYEGYLSPIVIERYGKYMQRHQWQSDGGLRDSANWQKGIPLHAYMKSGWRHFLAWWLEHRGKGRREYLEEAICGVLFNAMGYLHELIKGTPVHDAR